MRLPPLRSLQVFICAAKHLNFTRAAEELFVTHVSVSLQVKQLEEYLGVKLFRKVGRKLELTPFAADYARNLQTAFDQIEQATEHFLLANEHNNLLNVVVPNIFAMRWLMPKLSEFQQLHPHIEVRLCSPNYKGQDYIRKLEQGAADIVICLDFDADFSGKKLQCDFIFQEELVLICRPDHEVAKTKQLTAETTLLLMNTVHRKKFWEQYLREMTGENHSLAEYRTMIFQDSNQVIHAASNGLGVGLANRSYVSELVNLNRISIPIDLAIPGGCYACLTSEQNLKREKVQIFRNWLLSMIK
ncbi:LysR substrate-binding domain-containing protein [Piscirickettsia litoralis]|uniref:LysR family transcriptional regulator n=1 Tax=Piscirickettsia litoralis TaxID=1891921 RepID=A0ABX3A362_9GAMM|nr:LysR substrate-binding domain-containing protein [Piscirickettsia litoralis]ODN42945.1 LysR family transcriptional regulator [Piscirickettsia litoralis]